MANIKTLIIAALATMFAQQVVAADIVCGNLIVCILRANYTASLLSASAVPWGNRLLWAGERKVLCRRQMLACYGFDHVHI